MHLVVVVVILLVIVVVVAVDIVEMVVVYHIILVDISLYLIIIITVKFIVRNVKYISHFTSKLFATDSDNKVTSISDLVRTYCSGLDIR